MFELLMIVTAAGALVVILRFTTREDTFVFCLVVALIITALLSGIDGGAIGAAGVQVRRLCIILLACLAFSATAHPPLPTILLICASLVALGSLVQPEPPDAGLSIAVSILLLHGPASITLYSWMVKEDNARRVAQLFVIAAIFHNILSVTALGDFEGGDRYAGAGSSSPLFAFAGAVLVSALLWGAIYDSGVIRIVAICLIPVTIMFTLLGAQRSGLVGLGVAVLPFVAVGLYRRFWKMLRVLISSGLLIWLVVSRTTLFDFAFGRFSSLDDNGRDSRWNYVWEFVKQRPLTGWGAGYREELGYGVHNSFLSILLEIGALGLVLWVAAIMVGLFQASQLVFKGKREVEGLALLSISWLLISVVGALVEDKLYRPSNLPAIVFVFGLLLASAAVEPTRRESFLDLPRSLPLGRRRNHKISV